MAPRRRVRQAAPIVMLTGAGGFFLAALDPPGQFNAQDDAPLAPPAAAAAGGASGASANRVVDDADPEATAPGTDSAEASGEGNVPRVTLAGGATTNDGFAPDEFFPRSTVAATPDCMRDPVIGPIVRTRWGPLQVAALVSSDGSRICAVDAPLTPSDHRKSLRINDEAVPRLNEAALTVQGTGFDVVTGATITSEAYQYSLQALLDERRRL